MREDATNNQMVAQKKRDVMEFLDILKKNPGMSLRQLIASYATKTGLKLKTVTQYYRQLVDARLVKEHEVE